MVLERVKEDRDPGRDPVDDLADLRAFLERKAAGGELADWDVATISFILMKKK